MRPLLAAAILAVACLGACRDDGAPAAAPAAPLDAGTPSDGPGGSAGAPDAPGFAFRLSCRSSATCPAGWYCYRDDHKCGAGGTCAQRPASCSSEPSVPVCGCDGRTYPSACQAALAGVVVERPFGACVEPAPGPFRCGDGDLHCNPGQLCAPRCASCRDWNVCSTGQFVNGRCPAGTLQCVAHELGYGCTPDCADHQPRCLDVPAACRDLPTCECLGLLNCGGIVDRRIVQCTSGLTVRL